MAASLTPEGALEANDRDLLPPCDCKHAKPPVQYTSSQVQKSFDDGIVQERPSRWVMDMQYRDIRTGGCKTRWGYPLTKSGDPRDRNSQEWILWDNEGKYCGKPLPRYVVKDCSFLPGPHLEQERHVDVARTTGGMTSTPTYFKLSFGYRELFDYLPSYPRSELLNSMLMVFGMLSGDTTMRVGVSGVLALAVAVAAVPVPQAGVPGGQVVGVVQPAAGGLPIVGPVLTSVLDLVNRLPLLGSLLGSILGQHPAQHAAGPPIVVAAHLSVHPGVNHALTYQHIATAHAFAHPATAHLVVPVYTHAHIHVPAPTLGFTRPTGVVRVLPAVTQVHVVHHPHLTAIAFAPPTVTHLNVIPVITQAQDEVPDATETVAVNPPVAVNDSSPTVSGIDSDQSASSSAGTVSDSSSDDSQTAADASSDAPASSGTDTPSTSPQDGDGAASIVPLSQSTPDIVLLSSTTGISPSLQLTILQPPLPTLGTVSVSIIPLPTQTVLSPLGIQASYPVLTPAQPAYTQVIAGVGIPGAVIFSQNAQPPNILVPTQGSANPVNAQASFAAAISVPTIPPLVTLGSPTIPSSVVQAQISGVTGNSGLQVSLGSVRAPTVTQLAGFGGALGVVRVSNQVQPSFLPVPAQTLDVPVNSIVVGTVGIPQATAQPLGGGSISLVVTTNVQPLSFPAPTQSIISPIGIHAQASYSVAASSQPTVLVAGGAPGLVVDSQPPVVPVLVATPAITLSANLVSGHASLAGGGLFGGPPTAEMIYGTLSQPPPTASPVLGSGVAGLEASYVAFASSQPIATQVVVGAASSFVFTSQPIQPLIVVAPTQAVAAPVDPTFIQITALRPTPAVVIGVQPSLLFVSGGAQPQQTQLSSYQTVTSQNATAGVSSGVSGGGQDDLAQSSSTDDMSGQNETSAKTSVTDSQKGSSASQYADLPSSVSSSNTDKSPAAASDRSDSTTGDSTTVDTPLTSDEASATGSSSPPLDISPAATSEGGAASTDGPSQTAIVGVSSSTTQSTGDAVISAHPIALGATTVIASALFPSVSVGLAVATQGPSLLFGGHESSVVLVPGVQSTSPLPVIPSSSTLALQPAMLPQERPSTTALVHETSYASSLNGAQLSVGAIGAVTIPATSIVQLGPQPNIAVLGSQASSVVSLPQLQHQAIAVDLTSHVPGSQAHAVSGGSIFVGGTFLPQAPTESATSTLSLVQPASASILINVNQPQPSIGLSVVQPVKVVSLNGNLQPAVGSTSVLQSSTETVPQTGNPPLLASAHITGSTGNAQVSDTSPTVNRPAAIVGTQASSIAIPPVPVLHPGIDFSNDHANNSNATIALLGISSPASTTQIPQGQGGSGGIVQVSAGSPVIQPTYIVANASTPSIALPSQGMIVSSSAHQQSIDNSLPQQGSISISSSQPSGSDNKSAAPQTIGAITAGSSQFVGPSINSEVVPNASSQSSTVISSPGQLGISFKAGSDGQLLAFSTVSAQPLPPSVTQNHEQQAGSVGFIQFSPGSPSVQPAYVVANAPAPSTVLQPQLSVITASQTTAQPAINISPPRQGSFGFSVSQSSLPSAKVSYESTPAGSSSNVGGIFSVGVTQPRPYVDVGSSSIGQGTSLTSAQSSTALSSARLGVSVNRLGETSPGTNSHPLATSTIKLQAPTFSSGEAMPAGASSLIDTPGQSPNAMVSNPLASVDTHFGASESNSAAASQVSSVTFAPATPQSIRVDQVSNSRPALGTVIGVQPQQLSAPQVSVVTITITSFLPLPTSTTASQPLVVPVTGAALSSGNLPAAVSGGVVGDTSSVVQGATSSSLVATSGTAEGQSVSFNMPSAISSSTVSSPTRPQTVTLNGGTYTNGGSSTFQSGSFPNVQPQLVGVVNVPQPSIIAVANPTTTLFAPSPPQPTIRIIQVPSGGPTSAQSTRQIYVINDGSSPGGHRFVGDGTGQSSIYGNTRVLPYLLQRPSTTTITSPAFQGGVIGANPASYTFVVSKQPINYVGALPRPDHDASNGGTANLVRPVNLTEDHPEGQALSPTTQSIMRVIVISTLGFVVLAGAVPVPQLAILNPDFDRSSLSRIPLIGPGLNGIANQIFDVASSLPEPGPVLSALLGKEYRPFPGVVVPPAPVLVAAAPVPVVHAAAVSAPQTPAINIVDSSTSAGAAPAAQDVSSDTTLPPADATAPADDTTAPAS
ncbi:hypothetical protein ONZ45_g14630 [Pleurotus djamor]|nr:hypothetical protein ONZ45_g14630 [Pleurotus djamor]